MLITGKFSENTLEIKMRDMSQDCYENKPLFHIYYGINCSNYVESKKSTSQAASFFVKVS